MTNQDCKDRLFFIDQHGCAKNQVDGELIIARMNDMGWQRTDNPDEAILIIVNSCGFIEDAKKESLESVLSARSQYPDKKILLAGCLAERYSKDLYEGLDEIDGIFGNGDISKLDGVVSRLMKDERVCEVPPQEGVCDGNRYELLNFPGSAYVKITEGCNNCCSFCAIPIIRGNLRSRPVSKIIDEIKDLLSKGIFEINLIGQDLASFGKDFENCGSKSPLSVLLSEISKIEGKFWIRLLYIHPDNFPLDILPVIKADNRILPYFDIPFQSGDDEIILKMNRHGSAKKYLELVDNIKSNLDDFALRTTFLCGFPGEDQEKAENTRLFLKNIKPDWSGCFAYSKEDNTVAATLKKQVSKKVASARAENLKAIQAEITVEKLRRHVGKILPVLIEEIVPNENEGLAIGRCWFQAPEVDGSAVVRFENDDENAVKAVQPGKVVNARIVASSEVDVDSIFESSFC